MFERIRTSIAACLVGVSLGATCAHAEDFTQLGGDLTSSFTGPAAIQVFSPNISSEERRLLQLSGFSPFHQHMTEKEGVGPRFVNNSCGGCHVHNGRGPIKFNSVALGGASAVIKVAWPDGVFGPPIGPVLQNHSVTGRQYHNINLQWTYLEGSYPDGTKYTLRKPRLRFTVAGVNSRRTRNSLRMSPALVGMGLLEHLDPATIEALADPSDANNDGISGRANYAMDVRSGEVVLGRFGYKALQPTVEQQSAAALANEMGIANSLFIGLDDVQVELPDETLNAITFYEKLGGMPAARSQSDPVVQQGIELFRQVKCDACHISTMKMPSDAPPEMANQTIHPFTDLLLHDMGRELSDRYVEGAASGKEWRTTPLWGLGYSATLSTVSPRYLHDGRARTIEESILWHAGEAEESRDAFMRLNKEQRDALLLFLKSL